LGAVLLDTLRTTIATDLRGLFLRLKQLPYNTQLALRAFGEGRVAVIARDLGMLVLVSYGALIVLRRLITPLVRHVANKGLERTWLARLWRRALVTGLQIAPIVLALLVSLGYLAAIMPEDRTEARALEVNYLSAFVMVELVRAGVRFFTSPTAGELRLLPFSDRGARAIQRFAAISIIFMGYGQLVIAPAVTEETSVFVGRAFSSLIAMISVLYAMVVVALNRRKVAAWLRRNESTGALDQAMGQVAERWHIPIQLYLLVLLVIVSTNTGNVLLPLLNSTLEFALIVFVGYAASSLARHGAARRLRVPEFIATRLPMLETRLNRLVPAFFTVVRVLVVLMVVLTLLNKVEFLAPFRMFGTEAGSAFLSGLFGVGVITLVTVMIYLALSSWVDYQLNPFVGGAPTPRMITLLTLMRNAVTIVIVVIALLLSFSQLGLDIGPLLASAGVLGLAISFGAQKMVEDIITGVFIQLENAMNVGDVVDVGGVVGTVEKLTVRSVTLRDLQGVVHVIPFSSAAMVSNFMREFSYYVCDMGVAYREDIEEVKQAMLEAYEQLRQDEEQARNLLGELEWFGLNSFDASAVTMRARIKTAPGQQWAVGRAYNALLKEIFDARGIEIPFPHQTLYFGEDRKGNAPPVQVVLHTSEPETSKAVPVSDKPEEDDAQAGDSPETKKRDASGPQGPDMPAGPETP